MTDANDNQHASATALTNGDKRKYTDIFVSRQIYVSSTYDYFVRVTYTVNGGKREGKDFHFNSGWYLGERNGTWDAPQYMRQEVARRLATILTSPDVKFYEYDRDGNKRYENLRYWDAQTQRYWALKFESEAKHG